MAPPVSCKNATSVPSLARGRFYGDVRRQWGSDLVTMSVVAHARGAEVPEHAHRAAFFTLLLQGAYREASGGTAITYAPLSAVYHPPGLTHTDAIGPDGALFFLIEIGAGMLDDAAWQSAGVATMRDLTGGDLVWTLLRLYGQFEAAPGMPLAVEEEIAGVIGSLKRHRLEDGVRPPAWLARVDDLIAEDFREPLYLGRLAREAGVHPVHLSRVYRRHRGRPIRETVLRLRVLEACRLITGSGDPLAAIAQQAGFADQSHLTNVCRRITGRSPASFRRFRPAAPAP